MYQGARYFIHIQHGAQSSSTLKWSLQTCPILKFGDQFNSMDQPSLNYIHEDIKESSARGFQAKDIFMINVILNSFS